MTGIFLFILGLIIGSFLNVLAFRYSPEGRFFDIKKWGGRSHCLFCMRALRWYELIPLISFIIQEGRCLVCRKRLSWQYPLVELASGLTFLLPLYFFNYTLCPNPYTLSILWTLIFLTFILIWAIDFRLSVVPDELNLVLGILGLILIYVQNIGWLNHLGAALAGALFLGLIIFISKGRAMGMGDLKLIAVLGLIFGWPDILLILVISFVIGAIIGVFLLFIGKKKMKDAIPFAPFLVSASLIVFFFSQSIIENYFQLFNLF